MHLMETKVQFIRYNFLMNLDDFVVSMFLKSQLVYSETQQQLTLSAKSKKVFQLF